MPAETFSTLRIQTEEGVVFSLPLAGPVTRFLAWAVDIAVVLVLMRLSRYVFSMFALLSPDMSRGLSILAFFALLVLYPITLEWFWNGQTVGKRVLRLRVMDERGLRLTFSQVALRNLLRAVDLLPFLYLTGGLACLINPHRQRLGDFAANTIVVRERRPRAPDLSRLSENKFNSLRGHAHLAARLRQRVSAEAARIGVQALLRRDMLEPGARVEVFRNIAEYYRGLVRYPEEAVLGLTDEQYVRNVIDIVYRTPGQGEGQSSAAPAGARGEAEPIEAVK